MKDNSLTRTILFYHQGPELNKQQFNWKFLTCSIIFNTESNKFCERIATVVSREGLENVTSKDLFRYSNKTSSETKDDNYSTNVSIKHSIPVKENSMPRKPISFFSIKADWPELPKIWS